MTANYHTHTYLCQHADGLPEEYVQTAIKNGLEILGFSDHAPFYFPDGYVSGCRMRMEQIDFYFDTLLALREKYKDYILSDIRKKYKMMLDAGATTFWETEVANKSPAGSLCHGWSALPVYYYEIFRGKKCENTSALL